MAGRRWQDRPQKFDPSTESILTAEQSNIFAAWVETKAQVCLDWTSGSVIDWEVSIPCYQVRMYNVCTEFRRPEGLEKRNLVVGM